MFSNFFNKTDLVPVTIKMAELIVLHGTQNTMYYYNDTMDTTDSYNITTKILWLYYKNTTAVLQVYKPAVPTGHYRSLRSLRSLPVTTGFVRRSHGLLMWSSYNFWQREISYWKSQTTSGRGRSVTISGQGHQYGDSERVAVVGPIGSGKTSLLQGLIGEMRKTSGSITFCGGWVLSTNCMDPKCDY